MAGRNPNVGRHSVGAPIARSGIKPPKRTGSASGSFVGGGVNNKTAARKEMSPATPSTSTNYPKQAAAMVRQSPEPFRNPKDIANLPVKSENPSGIARDGVSSPLPRSAPKNNPAAVGIKGAGMGSNNGLVVAGNTPRTKRAGSPFSVGVKQAKFYGR